MAWYINGMHMMDANSNHVLMVYDIRIAYSCIAYSLHRCRYGYETGPHKFKGC